MKGVCEKCECATCRFKDKENNCSLKHRNVCGDCTCALVFCGTKVKHKNDK